MNGPERDPKREGKDVLRPRYVAGTSVRDPGGDPVYGCVDWFQYTSDRERARAQSAGAEPRAGPRAR